MTMNKSKLTMIKYCLWVFSCISANHDNPSLGWVGDGQAQTNTIYLHDVMTCYWEYRSGHFFYCT